jgi:hypothetical protein
VKIFYTGILSGKNTPLGRRLLFYDILPKIVSKKPELKTPTALL